MLDTHLARKITARALPSVTLHRHALVTQLQEALVPQASETAKVSRYKLVLCCAPAGYGKTTLLTDFARSTSLPFCWYFLDQTDTDPVVFLRTLVASVRQTFPHVGVILDPLFESVLSHYSDNGLKRYHSILDALCTALVNEVSESFVLILSNYEEINEDEMLTNLVNYLLTKLPDHVTLLIESRMIPDLTFTPLVIRDELGGLHQDDLRFSAQEIVEISRIQGGKVLTEREAEDLVLSFDGWIAGILLGTRVGQARFRFLTRQAAHPFASHSKALEEQQRQMLFTYIVDEILKQDAMMTSFVQSIAILQQIEPVMCNTLLNISDAAKRLARLERQCLFLTVQENASGLVYTFHPVIRTVLSEQFQRREPERFRMLHLQAAELWLASQNVEQAMYHALTSGATDLAAIILFDHADNLLQYGQYQTVARWLHALSGEAKERHPELLVLQATISLRQGQYALAFSLLDRGETLLTFSQTTIPLLLRVRIDLLRSQALFQTGEYHQAQEYCRQVLAAVSEQEIAICAAATMRLGVCACLQGDFPAGIAHLHKALTLWSPKPPPTQAIEIHQALANAYHLTGNFSLAQYHLAQVLTACEQVSDSVAKGNVLLAQGSLAQDQGMLVEAESAFLQALDLAQTVTLMQRGEAHALGNLASLAIEQGNYTQALTYAEQCLTLARALGNHSVVSDALVSRALSYLFLGDSASALLTIDSMEIPTFHEGMVGYEYAWRELTAGLILLHSQHVPDAALRLEKIEAALDTSDLKRERFQAKLRLAACRIAQKQSAQAIQLLQEVTTLLTTHRMYIHLVHIEIQRFPALSSLVQTHLQLSALRAVLEMTEPLEQTCGQLIPPLSCAENSLIHLSIIAFGEPLVLLDGKPVKRWRIMRSRELFFFLLAADHPMSKDAILAALWPEDDERAMSSFNDTIYQLRKLFGPTSLVTRQKAYALDLASCYGENIFYDVQVFRQARMEAGEALSSQDTASAKEALLKMVGLYRGEYGQPFYHDWCSFQRDELRTHYLEACRQLAQIFYHEENWQKSAEYWQQMLRLDQCLEEAYLGLIRCYLKQGKRGAALRQYQACQTALEEDLGVEPGPILQNLYQRLTGYFPAE